MEQVLGVAIGIVLICLLLSIIASHVREIMAAVTAKRAMMLEGAILKMVGDPAIYQKIVGHPLIETISFDRMKLFGIRLSGVSRPRPTYIPSQLFTRVLLVALGEIQGLKTTDVNAIVTALPANSPLRQKLSAIIFGIENKPAECVSAVEQWYDGTMVRVNGLYKRHTQAWLLALGMVLAVVFNANLFNITQRLWTSQDARDAVTATAQMYSCKGDQPCALPSYEAARNGIQHQLGAELPLGYDLGYVRSYWSAMAMAGPRHWDLPHIAAHWVFNFVGWLLMAIAVSLGAPFWFDLLNKLVNLRMAGLKPATATPLQASGGTAAASTTATAGGSPPAAPATAPDNTAGNQAPGADGG